MQATQAKYRPLAAMAFAAWLLFGMAGAAIAASEWLARCSQCVNPSIFSKTGVGSADAVAQARITRSGVEDWCASWQPDDKACVKQQLAGEDLKKVYKASANCTAGSFTPIDGRSYKLAGVWDGSDIGAGRSKWRDAAGKIVSRDNATGGLAISQQWEILCPGAGKGIGTSAMAPTAPGKNAVIGGKKPSILPVDEYAVGQIVLAKYGSDWIRAKINAIQHKDGPQGPQTAYDISLDNGKRGMVPERMLKPAP